MREIKFRGRDLDTGKFVYGDFVHCVPMSSFPGIVDDDGSVHEVYFDSVAQLIGKDGNGDEIYDGDFLQCDLDGLKAAVGNGFMADDIIAARPKNYDAKLQIKFCRDQYYLEWVYRNEAGYIGRADTGVNWGGVLAYIKFFTVIEA